MVCAVPRILECEIIGRRLSLEWFYGLFEQCNATEDACTDIKESELFLDECSGEGEEECHTFTIAARFGRAFAVFACVLSLITSVHILSQVLSVFRVSVSSRFPMYIKAYVVASISTLLSSIAVFLGSVFYKKGIKESFVILLRDSRIVETVTVELGLSTYLIIPAFLFSIGATVYSTKTLCAFNPRVEGGIQLKERNERPFY